MQSYERYAAVALLFLVTVAVVGYFWDDGSGDLPDVQEGEIARVEETGRAAPDARASKVRAGEGGSASSAPLSGRNEVNREVPRASTRKDSQAHGVEPIRRDDSGRGADSSAVARSQSAEELKGLSQIVPRNKSGTDRVALRADSSFTQRQPSASREGSSRRGGTSDVSQPVSSAKRSTEIAAPKESSTAIAKKPAVTGTRPYTVKSGDALALIAKRELGKEALWTEIAALNQLSPPYTIIENMKLLLPTQESVARGPGGEGRVAALGSAALETPLAAGQRRYVLAKGELLSVVLERELGTYRRSIGLVTELNPGLNPDRVFEGQAIVLPSRSAIPAAAGSSPASAKRGKDAGQPTLSASNRGERVAAAGPNSEFVVR